MGDANSMEHEGGKISGKEGTTGSAQGRRPPLVVAAQGWAGLALGPVTLPGRFSTRTAQAPAPPASRTWSDV